MRSEWSCSTQPLAQTWTFLRSFASRIDDGTAATRLVIELSHCRMLKLGGILESLWPFPSFGPRRKRVVPHPGGRLSQNQHSSSAQRSLLSARRRGMCLGAGRILLGSCSSPALSCFHIWVAHALSVGGSESASAELLATSNGNKETGGIRGQTGVEGDCCKGGPQTQWSFLPAPTYLLAMECMPRRLTKETMAESPTLGHL